MESATLEFINGGLGRLKELRTTPLMVTFRDDEPEDADEIGRVHQLPFVVKCQFSMLDGKARANVANLQGVLFCLFLFPQNDIQTQKT